jgi:hypothetical protein
MTGDDVVLTAKTARRTLDDACAELDTAVLGLPDALDDDVLASPALLGLLLRVLAARRQVAALEWSGNLHFAGR